MSYQQCTRFRTTLDFDHEYLWYGSSSRQTENGVMKHDFSTFGENNFVNFGPLTKNDLDLWPMTLKFSGFRAVAKEHVHAKFHRAKCSGSRVIVRTKKKTRTKTIQSVATARSVIKVNNMPEKQF